MHDEDLSKTCLIIPNCDIVNEQRRVVRDEAE